MFLVRSPEVRPFMHDSFGKAFVEALLSGAQGCRPR